MKKRIFFLHLIFGFFYFSCISEKSKNVKSKNESYFNNKTYDSIRYFINSRDTILFKKNLYKCYDSLDLLTKTSENIALVGYEKLFKILDSSFKIYNINVLFKNRAYVLQSIIFLSAKINDTEKVITYYKEFSRNNKTFEIPNIQKIQCMHDVGSAYHKIGDTRKTELAYIETKELAKKINSYEDIGKATVNLNRILNEKKFYDSIINQSNSIVSKDIPARVKASLLGDIANAYSAKKNFTNASSYNTKAKQTLLSIDSADRPENYKERLCNVYKLDANFYRLQNNFSNADIAYTNALNCFPQNLTEPNRYLAKLNIEIGKYKNANPNSSLPLSPLEYYDNALLALMPQLSKSDALYWADTTTLRAENTIFEAMDAKANYLLPNALQEKDYISLKKILEYYTVSFKVEKLLLNNFVYDNAKIDFLEQSKTRTKNALQACYALYKWDKSQIWLDKAFQFIENNKAAVLLQKLKQNTLLQNTIANDSLVEQLNITKSKLLNIEKTKNIAEKESLIVKKETLENALQEKYPQLKQGFSFNQSYTIKSVQQFLKKETALLEYFCIDSALFTLVVEKSNSSFLQKNINPNIISQLNFAQANVALQQNNPDAFAQLSNSVYQQVFPTSFSKNIDELIIIPDEQLNNTSFDALMVTNKGNYSIRNFLLHQYTIAYSYSYGVLLQKSVVKNSTNNVAVFTPAIEKTLGVKEKLLHTKEEGTAIKNSFGKSSLFENGTATKSAFLENYTKYNVLHIATHSQPDSVEGNSSIDFYDTTINANLFYQNSFNANLVFLSACETTQGKLTGSEGVLSLARSLYYAGANNVIASQWKINDATTAQLVGTFYKNIPKQNYIHSLHQAKVSYLQNASAEKRLPFYWASFVHIGYNNPPVKNYTLYYILGLLLLTTFAYLGFKNLKKHRK